MDGLQYLLDCTGILPILILFATGILILLLDAFAPRGRKGRLAALALAGVLLAMIGWWRPLPVERELFGGMLFADSFGFFFDGLFLATAALIILFSAGTLDRDRIDLGEYYALLLFSVTGMMLMARAANLIMLFLGLEVLSIAIYILVGMPRHERKANEACLKYFLLGAFSSGFFLYGMTFIYGASGSLSLAAMAAAFGQGDLPHNPYLLLGTALLLVGFSFKIALVPFHMWTPDVYEGAPTPITAYMAVAVKAAVFAALARVFWMALPSLQPRWTDLFWVLAVLTMTVGNVAALVQTNIKRMLAYSSIAHAGYILVAVVAGSAQGLTGMLVYLAAYTFMNVGAFGVVILVQERLGVGEDIDDCRGLGFTSPALGAAMAVFLFSLAGIPPTAGFVAKFFVFLAAIEAGFTWLVILAVVNSAVAVYYYLRVVIVMYSRAESPIALADRLGLGRIPSAALGALIVALWATLQIGILPQSLWELARHSVSALL